tara:strand:- start:20 stop:274 length:255 start_codon:yes stop_codon:yes gene_type:complete
LGSGESEAEGMISSRPDWRELASTRPFPGGESATLSDATKYLPTRHSNARKHVSSNFFMLKRVGRPETEDRSLEKEGENQKLEF